MFNKMLEWLINRNLYMARKRGAFNAAYVRDSNDGLELCWNGLVVFSVPVPRPEAELADVVAKAFVVTFARRNNIPLPLRRVKIFGGVLHESYWN